MIVGHFNTLDSSILSELKRCEELSLNCNDLLPLIVEYSRAWIDESTCALALGWFYDHRYVFVKMFRITVDEEPDAEYESWSMILPPTGYQCYGARTNFFNHDIVMTGFNSLEYDESPSENFKCVARYSFKNKSWQFLQPMLFEHFFHATIVHDGSLYAFGGSTIGGNHANCEVYSKTVSHDKEVYEWKPLPPMKIPRRVHTAILHCPNGGNGHKDSSKGLKDNNKSRKNSDKIYIVGGYVGKSVKQCECFDIASQSWISPVESWTDPVESWTVPVESGKFIPDLSVDLHGSFGFAIDNDLYVTGGVSTPDNLDHNNLTFTYSLTENKWSQRSWQPPKGNYVHFQALENRKVLMILRDSGQLVKSPLLLIPSLVIDRISSP